MQNVMEVIMTFKQENLTVFVISNHYILKYVISPENWSFSLILKIKIK